MKKSARSKGTLGSKANKSVWTRRKGNADTYKKFTDLMIAKLEQGIQQRRAHC
ncbi:hypothetical protein FHS59_001472 [Algoriphagus iocasae]|uniref:Uncharacterized protein n=1 Tax=Algoriphagus iocasae TaxID=1836499 RepID=A0A841MK56_9BACT|nr:hypothetical protein [Algoriphagus iocasae]MBB6325857.1 hypothetical protein [Algoriphagus iocasae]